MEIKTLSPGASETFEQSVTFTKLLKKKIFQKNYDDCLEALSKFDLNGQYSECSKYSECVQFLLRSSCHAYHSMKNPEMKHKRAIVDAFTTVFSDIGAGACYDRFFLILNWFTYPKDFEKYAALFAESEFDLKIWLQAINTNLFQVLNKVNILNDTNQTKQKDIYLQLTRVLLLFVNAETQRTITSKGRWEFVESRRFLDECQKCILYRIGDKQYNEGFRMLSKFLDCLSTEADAKQIAANMQKYLKKIR